jgi:hypothetical protein
MGRSAWRFTGEKHGKIPLPFNTAAMYRGHVNSTRQAVIEIYN